MIRKALVSIIALAAFAGCENYDMQMRDQVTFKHQEYPSIGAPAGSVPITGKRVDYSELDGALIANPYDGDVGLTKEGGKLFKSFCTPCHGADGTTANAPVADKFDPRPANLQDDAVVELTEGEIFQTIIDGVGAMPAYKYELSDKEAWEVTLYVLSLQGRK